MSSCIVAYRLEDEYGNSPFYYNGHKVILPDNYYGAFLNPCRFKESDYTRYFYKLDLYVYLLNKTALTYKTGEVLFRQEDVISKTKTGRSGR